MFSWGWLHSSLSALTEFGHDTKKIYAMYLKKVDGPRAVRLPDGKVMTRADLPPAKTQCWVASRKALVVRAVLYGLMTQAEAMSIYDLSEEEFFEWVHAVRAYGDAGLKVTQLRSAKHSWVVFCLFLLW